MIGRLKVYNHWAFLEVEHDVGRYYRRLFLRQFGLKLERPSNEEHVTVISPEDTLDFEELRLYNGQELTFEVTTDLWWNGSAVWLPVVSNDILILRSRFGLREQFMPQHFCIGYI